jgi:DNA-binding PadR family transcriptional regulator
VPKGGQRRRRTRRGRGRTGQSIRLLEPVILYLLHLGPSHGYSLLDKIDEFGLGGLNPSVVYRALREMEEQGWVRSVWDGEETQGPPRRVYELTKHGDEMLALWVKDLQEVQDQISGLINTYRGKFLGE